MSSARWQGIRYLLVGGFNVLFTLGVFWILDHLFSATIGVQLVYWISALLGIANGFLWQRLFVWRSQNQWHTEFVRFLGLNLGVSVVNSLLLLVAVDGLRFIAFPSQVVITAVLVVVSYLITRSWVFGNRALPAEEPDKS